MAPSMMGHGRAAARNTRSVSCFRVFVAVFVAARSLVAGAQPHPAPDLQKLLQQIKSADTDQLAVSEEDGRFLRVMIATSGAKRVLEVGGAFGYSAVWMGLGLRHTGGRLTTIEFDATRAKAAAENVKKAGLADIVTVVPGDAFKEIPKIEGPFDVVFLDAWKDDYELLFGLARTKLDPGGIVVADNVTTSSTVEAYAAARQADPTLVSVTVPIGHGLEVTTVLQP